MLTSILSVVLACYIFTRGVIKNELFKSKIDNLYLKINKSLSEYKEHTMSELQDSLMKITSRYLVYIFIVIGLISFIPIDWSYSIKLFLYTLFFLNFGLAFSIKWIRNHRKFVKEHFFNISFLGLVFLPLILYYLGGNIYANFVNQIPFFKILPYALLWIQLSWSVIIVTIWYIGCFIIAIPLYLAICSIIYITVNLLKITEKYIDKQILDAIAGIMTVVLLCLEKF